MIVILTGATGKIGGEILKQCLLDAEITQILAITRRSLDQKYLQQYPEKLKNIIHKDFHNYPDELLSQLDGADACIWSLGDPFAKNVREIDVEYTLKAANAFVEKLQPQLGQSKKFKLMFVSGQFASLDQTKGLWFMQEARRAKGEAESKLFKLEQDRTDQLDVTVVRPGVVADANSWIPLFIVDLLQGVRADHLALACLEIMRKGHKNKTVYSHELSSLGKSVANRG